MNVAPIGRLETEFQHCCMDRPVNAWRVLFAVSRGCSAAHPPPARTPATAGVIKVVAIERRAPVRQYPHPSPLLDVGRELVLREKGDAQALQRGSTIRGVLLNVTCPSTRAFNPVCRAISRSGILSRKYIRRIVAHIPTATTHFNSGFSFLQKGTAFKVEVKGHGITQHSRQSQ